MQLEEWTAEEYQIGRSRIAAIYEHCARSFAVLIPQNIRSKADHTWQNHAGVRSKADLTC